MVIVIDASQSMQATDVAPNRLAAAKAAAIAFVESIPDKYNVSVVSMAGNSSILVPPTLAHNTVENAINSIQLQDGTAIGEGIYTAMRALQQAPKDPNKPDSVGPGRHRAAHRRLQHGRPRPDAGGGRGPQRARSRSTRSRTAPRTATSTWTASGSRCRSTTS